MNNAPGLSGPGEPTNFLVFTDLDGTLLDHHTYDFGPALPAISLLNKRSIPWVLNTSKTLAELVDLRISLNNHHPMIVENGGGIAMPPCYPLSDVTCDGLSHGFQLKTIGTNRTGILDTLSELHHNFVFTGFNDMSVAELVNVTGLSSIQAKQAMERKFSEPILWQDTQQKLDEFTELLATRSLRLLRGGRFIHVIGNCDKGTAMEWLSSRYRDTKPKIKTIALGDGENDIAMLKQADIQVIIRSSVNEAPLLPASYEAIITDQIGPKGWNAALLTLLNAAAPSSEPAVH